MTEQDTSTILESLALASNVWLQWAGKDKTAVSGLYRRWSKRAKTLRLKLEKETRTS